MPRISSRAVPVALRLALLVSCAAAAYSFSLRSLGGEWRYETPLADLVLVPLLAVGVLVASWRRHPYVGALRLGRLDLVLGPACLLVAFTVVAAGPTLWSKYFWAMRLDLLTLPLFVAAGIVLLFGARAVVPFAFAVGSLLLAWPLPYLALLEHTLEAFTRGTAAVVAAAAPRLHLATLDPTSDGTGFLVQHGEHRFSVVVASACSGANSLVGFFVLGVFALYFLEGRIVRRLAWLAAGAAVVWVFNIVRVLAILGAGAAFGERAALGILHPVGGLVALNAAVFVVLRSMRRFGLRWRQLGPADVDSPLAEPAPPQRQATPRRIVVRVGLLVCATVLVGLANGQLATAARGLSNDGEPAVAPFTERAVAGRGWTVRRLETIGWAAPYYGRHSSWVRYILRPRSNGSGTFTVWLDAVRSSDLGALDAYTLAHCYAFHGFTVDATRHVDLGDGVIGEAFVYTTSRTRWHAVSWQWPVRLADGRVDHERIVLLAASRARPSDGGGPSSGGISRLVLRLLSLRAQNDDENPALTHALQNVAAGIVAARIRSGA